VKSVKQLFIGEMRKAKAKVVKATKPKTKVNKSKHKLRQVKNTPFSNDCFYYNWKTIWPQLQSYKANRELKRLVQLQ